MSNSLNGLWRAGVVTVYATLILLTLLLIAPSEMHAAACANQYGSGASVPTGYGVPWNPLTTGKELMIKNTNCTSSNISVSVGMTGQTLLYVYKLGYAWDGGAWQSYNLSGAVAEGTDWFRDTATGSFASQGDQTFYVGYICQWMNNAWKCGCENAACATPRWQLQVATQSAAAPVVTISASPNSISAGQSSTITWSSTNATSCTASGGWSGTKGTSGTQSVSPTNTTTYTLACTGTGGNDTKSATVTVTGGSGPTPPAAAAAAGFTRLAFQEEFDNASGIDMNATCAPGFNFYRHIPFGLGINSANNISVSNGILTLTGGPEWNYGLGSTCGTGTNQWVGFDATGGAYFEASIAFDLLPGQGGPNGHGWPAFWSMADEHLWGNASGWIEFDMFEKWDNSQGFYLGNLHWWTSGGGHNSSQQDLFTPNGWDWSTFHTVGGLWQPGNRIAWYTDNAFKGERLFANNPWMANGDNQHWPVILGSETWPLRVDWVRVWMKP